VDSETKKPYGDGPVVNQTQIDPGSSLIGASPETSAHDMSLMNDPLAASDAMGFGLAGLAEGGPVPPARGLKSVLMRKPMGMPVPVLHTTIVIAAKPKDAGKKPKDKKAAKGVIQIAKPEDRPRAHGRVQVPRGSGAAIRGKRFGGIY
jgi:hypothetical protein